MRQLALIFMVAVLGSTVAACSKASDTFVQDFTILPSGGGGGGDDDDATEEEVAEARRLANAKYRQANSVSNRSRFRTAPSKIGKF